MLDEQVPRGFDRESGVLPRMTGSPSFVAGAGSLDAGGRRRGGRGVTEGHGWVLRGPAPGGVRGDEPCRERVLRQLPALAGTLPGTLPQGGGAERAGGHHAGGPEAVHAEGRV